MSLSSHPQTAENDTHEGLMKTLNTTLRCRGREQLTGNMGKKAAEEYSSTIVHINNPSLYVLNTAE